ncbi:hypothetical protein N7474_010284 [Penicillium riverlandense]|uniref:uncharacterized protein n=1 Tax=Penicillium riverlandense TaxID=1903569 RepID=UPI0025481B00|nr:uncharacterized protein N7474_010284 [Penicillium riverlandense]KAJ5806692.1 hypothetical protein N7474_010284 [Penicillium riverlandense]
MHVHDEQPNIASNRTGRPKGVKNKKTLERIKQLRAADDRDEEGTRVADNEQCTSNFQSSDTFELLRDGEMPDYLLPEPLWVDTLLTTTDLALPGFGDMDRILKRPQDTDLDSSPMQFSKVAGVHPSQPQNHPSSTCHCVRQITEQLANFKALSVSPQRLQPDFVLTVARDSLLEWRPYLECSRCEYSDDKDVLVLSVMALRALFNLIQAIGLQHKYQSRHDDSQEDISTASASSAPFLNSQNSFLGTYRLVCEEKRLVVDLLLYRTLKSLYRTAKNLTEKSLRMTGTASKRDSTSDQSSRSQSSPYPLVASPILCYGLPQKVTMSDRSKGLDSTGFSISSDEHDNYLQKSLQSLTANIESHLMKIQTPQSIQGQRDADTFGF